MKQMKKKALSLVLILAMLVMFLPSGAGSIVAQAASGDFTIENGVLTKYNGSGGNVVIPDGVTEIGKYAFRQQIVSLSVTVPDSVTSIGYGAFEDCYHLKKISLPPSVTSIGDYAFSGCGDMKSFTFPDGLTHIGDGILANCYSLEKVTIPPSVTDIGKMVFSECSYLKSVTIPGSVKSIDENAFWRCYGLMGIHVASDNAFFSDKDGVLFNKAQTRLLRYPCAKEGAYSISASVKSIGENAFYDCDGLTGVTIPGSVTIVEPSAFHSCANLTSVTLANGVTEIGDKAFAQCIKLPSLTIPRSVSSVDNSVVSECESMTHIYVESGHTSLSSKDGVLFNQNQTKLLCCPCGKKGAYSIPGSVRSMEAGAFAYCSSITGVTIPSSVTTIEEATFFSCKGLTNVLIPDSVNRIEDTAFYSCTSLPSVTIPGSVTSIGEDAFSLCKSLTNLTLANSVRSIGLRAFWYDPNLNDVTFIGTQAEWNALVTNSDSGLENKTVQFKIPPKSISIKKLPSKMTYTVGEKFDPTGMIVKVTYADGSTKEITSGYTYTPAGAMNTAGQQTIAVAYKENGVTKGTGFKVTVNPPMSSVSIKKLPSKMTYTVGEKFDPTGMIVKVTYADGSTKEITSGYTYTPAGAMNTAGQQTVAVSYKENGVTKGTGFKVTVNPADKTMSSITIKKLPSKMTYTVGQKFDPTGMIVKVTYADGSTKEITSGYTYTPTGAMNTAGQQTIAVSYKANGVTKGTGFKVTVNKVLSSISIKKLPSKMTYTVGEKFDPTGMIVRVNYNDGTSKEITSGYTYTPTGAMNTAGQQTVAVSYKENGVTKGTGFKVTVNPPMSSVSIKKLPSKMTYTVGEKFDPAGMIVKVTYADGSTKEITSGYTYTPTGAMNTAGQQTIAVAYKENGVTQGTGFKVTVNPAGKTVASVAIKTKPTKQVYNVGETFAPAGMKLKVTYTDNTTAEITSGYTYTPTGKLTTAGQQKIVVAYGGKSTGFYVTVNRVLSSVSIKKLPAKITYTVGETFDPTGMIVKVTYTDGTTAEVTSGYTYTPTGKFTAAGQQKIVVSYGGKSTGFYVTVG